MADKPDRNDPCHCGSGRKYKNCCQGKDDSKLSSKFGVLGIVVAFIIGLLIVGYALSGGGGQQDCPPGTVWSDAHQHCH